MEDFQREPARGALKLEVGAELPPLVQGPIRAEQLRRYAEVSGDDNPIHLDERAARAAGLPGVIAHGMLVMGFMGRQLVALAGPEAVRRFRVRFRAVVRPGDILTCRARVTELRPDGRTGGILARLQLWAENQRGERVTAGEAEVLLSPGTAPSVP